jgi:hypothetical protein
MKPLPQIIGFYFFSVLALVVAFVGFAQSLTISCDRLDYRLIRWYERLKQRRDSYA